MRGFRPPCLLFVPLAATLLCACAFTDVPVDLPIRGLEETVPGGGGRKVVVFIPFSDERPMPERCGMQKNGYNMDTADAICKTDPAAWIAALLADELRASGFDVSTPERADAAEVPESALQIQGSLLQLFIEPVIGMWSGSLEADLSVRLDASSRSGLSAERTFFVKGWKGGVMLSTAQPYHTSLHRATQAMLEEMVRAIVELMDAYPELGVAGPEGSERVLLLRVVGARA